MPHFIMQKIAIHLTDKREKGITLHSNMRLFLSVHNMKYQSPAHHI